eukprot:scaffold5157_cov34-Attheya_sp.AAC.1
MSAPVFEASASDDSTSDLLLTTAVKGTTKCRRMMTSKEASVAVAASSVPHRWRDSKHVRRQAYYKPQSPPLPGPRKQLMLDPCVTRLMQSDDDLDVASDDEEEEDTNPPMKRSHRASMSSEHSSAEAASDHEHDHVEDDNRRPERLVAPEHRHRRPERLLAPERIVGSVVHPINEVSITNATKKKTTQAKTKQAKTMQAKTTQAKTSLAKTTQQAKTTRAKTTQIKMTKAKPTKVKPIKGQPTKTKPTRMKRITLRTGLVKATEGFQLSLMNTSVCYPIDGPFELLSYTGHIPECAKVFIEDNAYLYGAVCAHSDKGKYKIEWEYTALKAITMETEGVFYGVQLAQTNAPLRQLLDHNNMVENAQHSFKEFIHAFDDDDNPPEIELDSDGEDDLPMDKDGETPSIPVDDAFSGYAPPPEMPGFRFDMSNDMKPVDPASSKAPEKIHNITWHRDTALPEHPDKSNFGCTKIKVGATSKFDTPLNSFLAFLPIPIWETMVEYSNINAQQKKTAHPKGWISGHPWNKDLCLEELMTFWSILFEMTLHPTPGRQYNHMWSKSTLYPFTQCMAITRFRQIRSIIHLNDNECKHTSKKDSLVKIRPLLQVLKQTLASHIDVGDELALDEASLASKSKFGRGFIMYNPMKPGGKFHYRFYFVCEADNYNLVRFIMHTRTNADLADGFNTSLDDDISDTQNDAPPE